jgi:selenoprotein W-related protein
MTSVEIEYCVPCGHLERAIDTQRTLLTEFGRSLDGVRLKTGHRGVFKVRIEGEQIFDRATDSYDIDAIKESVRQRLGP